MENWKKAERKSFDRLLPPERATGGLGMKCFCTNCFDTKEIVDYIDLHGELGKCTVCKSRGVKRITADRIGRLLRLYLDDVYIDRKAEVMRKIGKKKCSQERLVKLSENEGWQSVEEIFIEDKEIFSEKIPEGCQREMMEEMFAAADWEKAAYGSMTERRYVPK